jgi:hypothetical protein
MFLLALASLAFAATPTALRAQTTTCKTANCAAGKDASGNPNRPAECQNRALPRQLDVTMDSTTLKFIPANIRIEGEGATPGSIGNWQCIQWRKVGNPLVPWHSSTEDTLGSSCSTSTLCSTANTTPPCDWETGNIDASLEFSVCHYKATAPGSYHYQCRLHVSLGMVGNFTVVQPIQLLVNKGPSGEAMLDWAVGGIGPWNVFRDTTASMPAATNLTPSGTLGRSFTDSTSLAPGSAFFYLVQERN